MTNAWPPGNGENVYENTALTAIPATNEPLVDGSRVRLQMNITVSASNLFAGGQRFKLQYAEAEDCTAAAVWVDIGLKGSDLTWRLFDEASIGDSTTQVNNISTSTTSAEGYYSETSPTAANPNEVLISENMEWDWPIEANGVTENTSYCFRMLKRDGTKFLAYNADSYPKLVTAPGISSLMRHGNFYQNDIKKGFFWAN